ncbi:hypothetical protein ACH438_38515, partial [Nocardia sp. NPDC020380]
LRCSSWTSGRSSRFPWSETKIKRVHYPGSRPDGPWPQARPDLSAGAPATAEVLGAYAHRAEIPNDLWTSLVLGATEQIDINGYAYPFVFELLPNAPQLIASKCRQGARVRLAFADPDCAHVLERDALEQMNGTLAGRIRNALNMFGQLTDTPGYNRSAHYASVQLGVQVR